MRAFDLAVAALVAVALFLPKSAPQIERWQKWEPRAELQAADLQEALAQNPHDAGAAVHLSELYMSAVDQPDWALAALSGVRNDRSAWRAQAELATAHAQRFEWPEAVAAAQAALSACAPPGCGDGDRVRLDLFAQGLQAALRSGATANDSSLRKAADRSRPQVWVSIPEAK